MENTGNDSNNEWRALRLAARKCPQFYTNSFNTTGKLSDFLNQIATSSNVEGKDSKQVIKNYIIFSPIGMKLEIQNMLFLVIFIIVLYLLQLIYKLSITFLFSLIFIIFLT